MNVQLGRQINQQFRSCVTTILCVGDEKNDVAKAGSSAQIRATEQSSPANRKGRAPEPSRYEKEDSRATTMDEVHTVQEGRRRSNRKRIATNDAGHN